jgi:hypothetical protein
MLGPSNNIIKRSGGKFHTVNKAPKRALAPISHMKQLSDEVGVVFKKYLVKTARVAVL